MNFQTPEVFLKDLLERINKAEKEIKIESMLFESGEVLDKLINALISASERGVEVKVAHDWVSQKYVHGELPLISFPVGRKTKYGNILHNKNVKAVKKLLAKNILVEEISRPGIFMSLLPFSGRNHMKIYLVDNICWIGGINLSDESFSKIDFMVRFEDPLLSQEVGEIFNMNFSNINYEDFSKKQNALSLLVDGGKKNKSLIYKSALDLIKEANFSIIFMSQFIPDGKIMKELLIKAENGVKINVITSSVDSTIFKKYPERVSYLNFLKKIKKQSNIKLTHLDRHVHAKLILIDDHSTIFGSHNFVIPGVLFGTKEIAISTNNKELIIQIQNFLKPFLNN